MSNTKRSAAWKIISFILSAGILALALWMVLNKQYVADQLSVWSYTPTAAVEQINDRAKLTNKGTFHFYLTQPVVADQQAFNSNCPRQEVGSPILGCYTPENRIFIYDITDDKLDGIEEVTATHEMLHAVWQRQSESEKKRLAVLLDDAYAKLDDQDLKNRMEYYQRTEPTEITNELHSILGTEVPNLGSELEQYYNQYFDRRTVLGLHDKYNTRYKQLYGRADELYSLMATLGASIQERLTAYDSASAQLSEDISDFNARAEAGEFSSESAFAAERAQLVARTNELEQDRTGINNDVTTYNNYHDEYEAIASEIEVLNEGMDSFRTIEQTPSL